VAQLGLVGTGLIGASIGLAARARGWDVVGYDPDPSASAGAQRIGAIDEVADRDDLYDRSDVIAIAAQVNATLAEVAALRARELRERQLVIDVASVKGVIADEGARVAAFVPTHPMAGSERQGPDAARADLFEGRTWCYVPTLDERRTARARAFIEELGAKAIAVDAHEHDRIVALTSHLPQLVAYAFTQCVAERAQSDPELVDALCGPAARELLRLGRSSPHMWDEIFAINNDALARELHRFLRAIDDRRLSR
jgi:prephenate dehydrogenase